MVGFLGKQFLLSGTGWSANAEEHSTVTLKDGTVITGYFTSNGGPMSFFSFNPKTKVTTDLGGYGNFSVNYSDPYLIATDDGGFRVVYNEIAVNGGLFYRQYDANGTLNGPVQTLVTGWIEGARTYDTSTGFFTSYRDRTSGADPEYVGAFYNDAGVLLKTFDFADGKAVGGFAHPAPQATVLSNGNLAVVWQKSNLDGSFLQIFKPNGNLVGAEKPLGNIALHLHPKVIETHPDGGFVVAHVPVTAPPGGGISIIERIVIQKYGNNGKKSGPEINFLTDDGEGSKITSSTNFDVAFTKGGLIALAWTGQGVNPVNGTDVYFAVLSAKGNVIVGPQLADETLNDDQLDVQFNYLKNGNVFLTFKDDATVQFSHVASIQGRFVVDPDYIWEGDGQNNTKTGTDGDDVLLGLAGADTLNGGKGEDLLRGGAGDDVLLGGTRSDLLYGGGNDDKLSGEKGNDTLLGEAGDDILKGGAGDDDMRGGSGNDTILGGSGADTAYGGDGADEISGQGGADKLYGGAGNDKVSGGAGNDTVEGGDGKDVLQGNAGFDNLSGGTGKDTLLGGEGNDILRGGADNDVLRGGRGDDQLYGDDGDDKVYGEAGNDTFHGERGNDALFGGGGADVFLFAASNFDHDRIKDFTAGVDVLDMGVLAFGLEASGGSIRARDVGAGVKFSVDSDNWVIIENLTLADLTEGVDYIITNPF